MRGVKKELLFSVTKKDFEIQTFRSGGKGGQHQNKTDSGVRIIHKASGAVGESREHKSQHQNKKVAFTRLTQTKEFLLWHRLKCAEALKQKSVEQEVEEQMKPWNLKVEKKEGGKWVEC